jgi:hypothetical protein
VAIKAGHNNAVTQLMALIKCCASAAASERPGLTWLIKQQMAELDIPQSLLVDPQASPPLEG